MFTYIRPVKRNIKIINGIKAPAKGFGLVIVKTPKNNYYATMSIILYATKTTKYNKPNWTQ